MQPLVPLGPPKWRKRGTGPSWNGNFHLEKRQLAQIGELTRKTRPHYDTKLISRGQTVLKESEYTPPDTPKPLRTAGGGYWAMRNHLFALRLQTEIMVKSQKKRDST